MNGKHHVNICTLWVQCYMLNTVVFDDYVMVSTMHWMCLQLMLQLRDNIKCWTLWTLCTYNVIVEKNVNVVNTLWMLHNVNWEDLWTLFKFCHILLFTSSKINSDRNFSVFAIVPDPFINKINCYDSLSLYNPFSIGTEWRIVTE